MYLALLPYDSHTNTHAHTHTHKVTNQGSGEQFDSYLALLPYLQEHFPALPEIELKVESSH